MSDHTFRAPGGAAARDFRRALGTRGSGSSATGATTNPDVQGTFGSDGNNLIGNVGTATGFIGSDLVGTSLSPINPHIGPLANNGGHTKTIALLSGSPTINAGNSSLAPAFGITTDQRGEPRFAPGGDSMVDIGADQVDSVFASVATDGVDES